MHRMPNLQHWLGYSLYSFGPALACIFYSKLEHCSKYKRILLPYTYEIGYRQACYIVSKTNVSAWPFQSRHRRGLRLQRSAWFKWLCSWPVSNLMKPYLLYILMRFLTFLLDLDKTLVIIRYRYRVSAELRIRDPVPFRPLDPGWVKSTVRIRDPGWTTRIIFPRV